jgi:hypothetical protein
MENPYASSTTGIHPSFGSSGNISPQVVEALAGTKPWVRLCSVIGFIGAGFMILGGIVMMIGGAVGLSQFSKSSGAPTAMFGVLGAVYIVMAFLYIYPSVKLWSYGSRIVSLMSSRSEPDLIAALHEQRAFWKFVGIMICIVLASTRC